MKSVAILHGAGYVGRKLIESVLVHPELNLGAVTSRSHAGEPLWKAHPHLLGQTDLSFVDGLVESTGLDLIFVAAAHSEGALAVGKLLDDGFGGLIVDMSADFRHPDPTVFFNQYQTQHPRPDLLNRAWYGMPEVTGAPPKGTKLIANPGCFATAISLALYPLSLHPSPLEGIGTPVAITAMTGASGSGLRAKQTTHFPSRSGNVRAYKVMAHQHEAEIRRMAPDVSFTFVPVSGPWTSGIWGTAHVHASGVNPQEIYERAYASKPLVRLWPGELPELHWSVDTPFVDIGWIQEGDSLVVGFALDNLMKGAASQAIQNVNLAFGFPETMGLVPAK